jgi:hypothetical protein
LQLQYQSNRVLGRAAAYVKTIRVTGASVPADLVRVLRRVDVAGRTFIKEIPPLPNQIDQFFWDGKDAYGRKLQGQQPVTISIGFFRLTDYCVPTTPSAVPFWNVPVQPCNGVVTRIPSIPVVVVPAI